MIILKALSRAALVALLSVATFACSQSPAKSPGSNPEEMTPEEHRAAAEQEAQKAAEHEREKDDVGPSKPMTEETQKSEHQQQADQHRDKAEQHEDAAHGAESK